MLHLRAAEKMEEQRRIKTQNYESPAPDAANGDDVAESWVALARAANDTGAREVPLKTSESLAVTMTTTVDVARTGLQQMLLCGKEGDQRGRLAAAWLELARALCLCDSPHTEVLQLAAVSDADADADADSHPAHPAHLCEGVPAAPRAAPVVGRRVTAKDCAAEALALAVPSSATETSALALAARLCGRDALASGGGLQLHARALAANPADPALWLAVAALLAPGEVLAVDVGDAWRVDSLAAAATAAALASPSQKTAVATTVMARGPTANGADKGQTAMAAEAWMVLCELMKAQGAQGVALQVSGPTWCSYEEALFHALAAAIASVQDGLGERQQPSCGQGDDLRGRSTTTWLCAETAEIAHRTATSSATGAVEPLYTNPQFFCGAGDAEAPLVRPPLLWPSADLPVSGCALLAALVACRPEAAELWMALALHLRSIKDERHANRSDSENGREGRGRGVVLVAGDTVGELDCHLAVLALLSGFPSRASSAAWLHVARCLEEAGLPHIDTHSFGVLTPQECAARVTDFTFAGAVARWLQRDIAAAAAAAAREVHDGKGEQGSELWRPLGGCLELSLGGERRALTPAELLLLSMPQRTSRESRVDDLRALARLLLVQPPNDQTALRAPPGLALQAHRDAVENTFPHVGLGAVLTELHHNYAVCGAAADGEHRRGLAGLVEAALGLVDRRREAARGLLDAQRNNALADSALQWLDREEGLLLALHLGRLLPREGQWRAWGEVGLRLLRRAERGAGGAIPGVPKSLDATECLRRSVLERKNGNPLAWAGLCLALQRSASPSDVAVGSAREDQWSSARRALYAWEEEKEAEEEEEVEKVGEAAHDCLGLGAARDSEASRTRLSALALGFAPALRLNSWLTAARAITQERRETHVHLPRRSVDRRGAVAEVLLLLLIAAERATAPPEQPYDALVQRTAWQFLAGELGERERLCACPRAALGAAAQTTVIITRERCVSRALAFACDQEDDAAAATWAWAAKTLAEIRAPRAASAASHAAGLVQKSHGAAAVHGEDGAAVALAAAHLAEAMRLLDLEEVGVEGDGVSEPGRKGPSAAPGRAAVAAESVTIDALMGTALQRMRRCRHITESAKGAVWHAAATILTTDFLAACARSERARAESCMAGISPGPALGDAPEKLRGRATRVTALRPSWQQLEAAQPTLGHVVAAAVRANENSARPWLLLAQLLQRDDAGTAPAADAILAMSPGAAGDAALRRDPSCAEAWAVVAAELPPGAATLRLPLLLATDGNDDDDDNGGDGELGGAVVAPGRWWSLRHFRAHLPFGQFELHHPTERPAPAAPSRGAGVAPLCPRRRSVRLACSAMDCCRNALALDTSQPQPWRTVALAMLLVRHGSSDGASDGPTGLPRAAVVLHTESGIPPRQVAATAQEERALLARGEQRLTPYLTAAEVAARALAAAPFDSWLWWALAVAMTASRSPRDGDAAVVVAMPQRDEWEIDIFRAAAVEQRAGRLRRGSAATWIARLRGELAMREGPAVVHVRVDVREAVVRALELRGVSDPSSAPVWGVLAELLLSPAPHRASAATLPPPSTRVCGLYYDAVGAAFMAVLCCGGAEASAWFVLAVALRSCGRGAEQIRLPTPPQLRGLLLPLGGASPSRPLLLLHRWQCLVFAADRDVAAAHHREGEVVVEEEEEKEEKEGRKDGASPVSLFRSPLPELWFQLGHEAEAEEVWLPLVRKRVSRLRCFELAVFPSCGVASDTPNHLAATSGAPHIPRAWCAIAAFGGSAALGMMPAACALRAIACGGDGSAMPYILLAQFGLQQQQQADGGGGGGGAAPHQERRGEGGRAGSCGGSPAWRPRTGVCAIGDRVLDVKDLLAEALRRDAQSGTAWALLSVVLHPGETLPLPGFPPFAVDRTFAQHRADAALRAMTARADVAAKHASPPLQGGFLESVLAALAVEEEEEEEKRERDEGGEGGAGGATLQSPAWGTLPQHTLAVIPGEAHLSNDELLLRRHRERLDAHTALIQQLRALEVEERGLHEEAAALALRNHQRKYWFLYPELHQEAAEDEPTGGDAWKTLPRRTYDHERMLELVRRTPDLAKRRNRGLWYE